MQPCIFVHFAKLLLHVSTNLPLFYFKLFLLALSEPIDVYSEWVDACEAVAKNPDPAGGEEEDLSDTEARDQEEEDEDRPTNSRTSSRLPRSQVNDYDDDDDDDLF